MIQTKLTGLSEVKAVLEGLPNKLSRKILEKGLLACAVPMVTDANARAPVLAEATKYRKPGTVRKRIRALRTRPIRGMTATITIGVRGLTRAAVRNFKFKRMRKVVSKGYGSSGSVLRGIKGADNPNDPFYWKFLEFGTSNMAARPFLRPAFEAKKMQSAQMAAGEFKKEILRAARELNRGSR